jgi:hypothetical protein
VKSGLWPVVPFVMGSAALAYAFFTGRTPNRFYATDRATHPFRFWFDVSSWALIALVGAGLIAHASFGG